MRGVELTVAESDGRGSLTRRAYAELIIELSQTDIIDVSYNKGCWSKGLPIGNLTSRWLGNFSMNSFDHYMKHTLGIKYYGRYVDDFVIVHSAKEFLKGLIPKYRIFLEW